MIDCITSLLGIIILFVPLSVILLLVALDGAGCSIIKQPRTGFHGQTFYMYKIRTMKSAEVAFDTNNPVIKSDNENLTHMGKFLRKLKLDEFPQLLNVLKGEMSLIGPRPLLLNYLECYEPWEMKKYEIKPGMSGLSQVRGNGHLSTRERSYYDIYYARHVSLWLDAEILLKTPLIIFFGEEKFLKHVPPQEIENMKSRQKSEGL